MSDRDVDHAAQRQRVLARIEHDRQQLAGTIDELRRPIQKIQRLQSNVRAIVPALLVAGAAFLILRAVRGSSRNRRIDKALAGTHRSNYPVVQAKRGTSWFAWVLKFVSAYRIAVSVSETVRSLSHASGVAPNRPTGAIGPSAGTTGLRSAGPQPSRSQPTFERNPT